MSQTARKTIPWSLLTMKVIRDLARELEVIGRSNMSRKELVRSIQTRAYRDAALAARIATLAARPRKRRVSSRKLPHIGTPELAVPATTVSSQEWAPGSGETRQSVEPTAPPYLDRGRPIPDTYGDDRLGFMVKGPRSGYAYWELSGPLTERFRLAYGKDLFNSGRWALKLCSLVTKHERYVPLDIQSFHAYVDLEPGLRYQAHLGFYDSDGRFIIVLSSRPECTPRDKVSTVVDECHMIESDSLVAMVGGEDSLGNLGASSLTGIRFLQLDEGILSKHGGAC